MSKNRINPGEGGSVVAIARCPATGDERTGADCTFVSGKTHGWQSAGALENRELDRATDGLPALGRSLHRHRAGVDDAKVAASVKLDKPAVAQERRKLVALVLVHPAAEGL